MPVNSVDSSEFTGTFTIPYLNNEYTNQTRSLHNCILQNIAVTLVCQKKTYATNLSRYKRSIHRGLSNVVHDTKTFWTMAPQPTRKQLGVGASCTIKLRFLHPKNHIKDKIPNQTASQQLTGLIVQSKVEKIICKVNKDCIVFQHEDFNGQLIWALQCYVQVNIQGPEQSFFEEAPINTMSHHKVLLLQMLKMHPTPS